MGWLAAAASSQSQGDPGFLVFLLAAAVVIWALRKF